MLLIFALLFFAPKLNAQVNEANYEDFVLAVVGQCKAYRLRALPDSSLTLAAGGLRQLDSLNLQPSTAYYRLLLEQGLAYADKERFLLALRSVTRVVDAAPALNNENFRTYAELSLANIHIRLGNNSESRKLLKNVQSIMKENQYKELLPVLPLLQARWQQQFGFTDSARYYLDTFFALPDTPDHHRAEALTLLAWQPTLERLSKELDARTIVLNEAIQIYRKHSNYRAVSDAFLHLARLTVQIKDMHRRAISLVDSTLLYSRKADRNGQYVENTPGLALEIKGKAYEVLGIQDSALYNFRAGYARQMAYWRTNSAYKNTEAVQIHRNEQRDRLLMDQELQLRIQRNRNLGLIAFAGIILLFSFGTVFLYGRLQKAKELTESQAVSLKHSNQELVEAKNGLEDALRLQVMLKAELQHRIKNNMQLIMSILNQGQRKVDDPEVRVMMKDRKEQIASIALLHQRIDLQSHEQEVDPENYLRELVTNIEKSYVGIFPDVRLHLDLNVDLLHIDATVPVGLILNELVTNAYKYAFPEGAVGKIQVVFKRDEDRFELVVNDNGIGLPADYTKRSEKSLGYKLVKGLVRQLEGKIEWLSPEQGTTVKINF